MNSFFAATALALTVVSTPASRDWQETRWGMTPEQVSAVVPELRPIRFGATLSNARHRSTSDTELYGIAVEAEYYYGQSGLAFISFDVPFERCEDLVRGLVSQYGQPTKMNDQIILKLIIWEGGEARDRVVLMHSTARICDLRISPATDLEVP